MPCPYTRDSTVTSGIGTASGSSSVRDAPDVFDSLSTMCGRSVHAIPSVYEGLRNADGLYNNSLQSMSGMCGASSSIFRATTSNDLPASYFGTTKSTSKVAAPFAPMQSSSLAPFAPMRSPSLTAFQVYDTPMQSSGAPSGVSSAVPHPAEESVDHGVSLWSDEDSGPFKCNVKMNAAPVSVWCLLSGAFSSANNAYRS